MEISQPLSKPGNIFLATAHPRRFPGRGGPLLLQSLRCSSLRLCSNLSSLSLFDWLTDAHTQGGVGNVRYRLCVGGWGARGLRDFKELARTRPRNGKPENRWTTWFALPKPSSKLGTLNLIPPQGLTVPGKVHIEAKDGEGDPRAEDGMNNWQVRSGHRE